MRVSKSVFSISSFLDCSISMLPRENTFPMPPIKFSARFPDVPNDSFLSNSSFSVSLIPLTNDCFAISDSIFFCFSIAGSVNISRIPLNILSSPRVSLLPNNFDPRSIVLPRPDSLNFPDVVSAKPLRPPVKLSPMFPNKP